jgi:hypothetical protein
VILRAASRFAATQPGIDTWHCFSAGRFYDPSRLGVGSLIAVDEHVLGPGAEFTEHAHRRVDIVSWVASGVLRHDADVLVHTGEVLVQRTGAGIRHVEGNGADQPLRLVQMVLLSSSDASSTQRSVTPVDVEGGRFDVHRAGSRNVSAPAHLYVAEGTFTLGDDILAPGDSAILDAGDSVTGAGVLLVWELHSSAP